jgi:hypothetical protein
MAPKCLPLRGHFFAAGGRPHHRANEKGPPKDGPSSQTRSLGGMGGQDNRAVTALLVGLGSAPIQSTQADFQPTILWYRDRSPVPEHAAARRAPFARPGGAGGGAGVTDFRPGAALSGERLGGSVLISTKHTSAVRSWTTGPLSSRHRPRSVSGSPQTRPMRKCTRNSSLWRRCGKA